jgi:hypothetical protein
MRSPAVDNFLFDLPDHQRVIMEALRDLIFAQVKGVQEQLKWNCPFYSKAGLLCYLNYDRQLKNVVLAFVEGFLIEDKYEALQRGTKNIRKWVVPSLEALDEKQMAYYLRQAVRINQSKTRNFLAIRKKR